MNDKKENSCFLADRIIVTDLGGDARENCAKFQDAPVEIK